MNILLRRRLIALEQAPAAGCTVYRVFSTTAESDADADTEPVPGAAVVRIITGVVRDPGTP